MASERAQNQQNPADEDDDFDFGGFEAAEPEPAAQGMQAEAQASPWAAFALGNAQERPDLLCAQNRFPPYLDPSDISGASADSRSIPGNNSIADVAPLPSVAADLLGDAQFVEARQHPDAPEQGESRLNGRLPDLGLGINDNPLFAQPLMNGLAANLQAPIAAAVPDPASQQQLQPMRVDEVSAADGAVPPPQPPEVVNVLVPNIVNAPAVQNNDIQGVEEQQGGCEQRGNEQQQHEQEDVQEAQERNAALVAERQDLEQRLESLAERNRGLEEELERSRSELTAQRTRLQEIEVCHSETLEEVRRAGQEALSVVVEQYKEQLKTVMLQQQEASQQQMVETLREQTVSFQELLNEQRQKHEEEQAKDKEEARGNVEKALEETRGQVEERFNIFLEEEQEKWRRNLEKAVQEERAASQTEIQRVVREEQDSARERLDQARAEYSSKFEEERKRQEEALVIVRKEEAERARDHMACLVNEERERGRDSVREALEAARADTRSYIDEQRRRDSSIRQRHFASLDLFLESCRQQVSFLMNHERDDEGAILPLPEASGRRDQQKQQQQQRSDGNSSDDQNKDAGDS